MTQFELHQGDCLEVMKMLPDNSVDSCVTDPPYELGFMGKAWDKSGIAYNVELWREVYRVLKPGAYLLAFGGSRTYHRMACAIEDAGFEIRDQIQWIYGSGFPKSLDVSKAMEKAAGVQPVSTRPATLGMANNPQWNTLNNQLVMPPLQTDDAKTWDGWGTALKPAHEPICMARKPLEKGLTVAQNVLKWGTGAINIDGCRVEFASDADKETAHNNALGPVERSKTTKAIYEGGKQNGGFADTHSPTGRFPANVIHDGSDEVLARFPETTSGGGNKANIQPKARESQVLSTIDGGDWDANTGSASRFFYCAKASKSDRNGGLDGFPVDRPDSRTAIGMGTFEEKGVQPQQNHHPTVKPTALMQYLCRLITPPGGTVLDPYTGSGSTGKAAMFEGFRFIGIERELEYVEIATARIEAARTREPLFLEADSQKTQGGLF